MASILQKPDKEGQISELKLSTRRGALQELARELVREGKSISAVARTFDVHPATIYRVIEG
jgi:transposase-like protein